jgi:hypothetical protein
MIKMEIWEKIKDQLNRNESNILGYYQANYNKVTTHLCANCGNFLSIRDIILPDNFNESSYSYVLLKCSKCHIINAKEIKRKVEKAKVENISLLMLLVILLWKIKTLDFW